MSKQKGLAPILIVLLIALAVGGYLIYTNYSNNRYKTVSQQTKSTPIPTSQNEPSDSDETANWKTYINTKAGFEFKYPEGFQVKEEKPSSISITNQDMLNISVIVNDNTITDKNQSYGSYEWVKSVLNNLGQIPNNTDTKIGIKVSDVTISGVQGVEYKFTEKHTNETISIPALNTVFIKGNRSYLITAILTDYSETIFNSKYSDVFNQILSTFRFD